MAFKMSVVSANATFALVSSPTVTNEGTSATITLTTTGVQNGQAVPYTISGTNITSAYISGAPLTGSFIVQNGSASLVINIINDLLTSGFKTLTLTLSRISGLTPSVALGINDTSLTVASDVYWNKSVVIKTSGVANATNNTFIDSSTNNVAITRFGDTTQGTFSPFSNSGFSGYFDGASHLTTVNTPANFGAGNFTIECWAYFTTNTAGYQPLLSNCGTADGQGWGLILETANQLSFYMSSGTSWTYNIVSAYVPPVNTWVHIAIVRNGATLTMYANGISVGTFAIGAATLPSPTNNFYLGYYPYFPGGARSFTGYISNTRLVKGTAIYTANFTPPTTALTAVANTSLLTLQDNRVKDNSTNVYALTAIGILSTQAFTPYTPSTYSSVSNGGSVYFDGVGDSMVTSVVAGLSVGTTNFTLEWFMYPNNSQPASVIRLLGNLSTSFTANGWCVGMNGSTLAVYNYNYSSVATPMFTTTITPGVWTHVALTRSGSSWYLFVNGVQVGTITSTISFDNGTSGYLVAGSSGVTGEYWAGYISNLRLVKGTALYTAPFTPPTAPLTAIANTQLLLSGTNAGVFDNSGKIDIETVGAAKVSTSVNKFNSSLALDGSAGSYFLIPSSVNLNFGAGDYTIEAWINLNTLPANGIYSTFYQKGRTATSNFEIAVSVYNAAGVYAITTESSASGTSEYIAYSSGISLTTSTWYHVAVCRTGTSVSFFLNGVKVSTSTVHPASIYIGTATSVIGSNGAGSSLFNGYVEDFRITKGTARYTATFTPPAAAF
jgi:hypothetical protein